jgi:hypothetical protein
MTVAKVSDKPSAWEDINDRLYDVITSTDSVSAKILATMLMVHELKREWNKRAYINGVVTGLAVSAVAATIYSFFQ